MTRVSVVRSLNDCSSITDEASRKDVAELADQLFRGKPNARFEGATLGWALLTTQSPRLTLLVKRLTEYIALEMPWCSRRDLRELAIQTVNFHFACAFSFQSHLVHSKAAGLSAEALAAIPHWRTTNLFTVEQRLVIEYALAVTSGDVSDELFSRVVQAFGERGAIECTTVIAHWSFWAMFLNAFRPQFEEAGANG
jgi:alkylhydroperoxidase family enzyme